jgi:hypothetical protein
MMARGPQQQSSIAESTEGEDEGIKENKIVMTELMSQLLRQSKDPQMLKAYTDCFLLLTKTFYQNQSNKPLQKFLAFTFKELLKNYLGGRMSSNAINVRLFQSVFEQNPGFGWQHLIKVILKCIVSTKVKGAKAEGKTEGEYELMPE